MAASATDKFMKVGSPGTATTLASPGYTAGVSTSITVGSTANWPTDTGVVFAIDEATTDSNGNEVRVEGTYNEFVGTVASAISITNVDYVDGDSERSYSAGATTRVYIPVSAERENRLAEGMLVEHDQDGTHGAVTTSSINNAGTLTQTGAATLSSTLAVTGATTLTGALTVKSYDGWITTADTWTYASATTFTIAGVDRTSQFPVGTKIKLTQTTVKYFYVTSSSFSTDTTITVTGGSDYSLANASITSPALSYDATPQGFPGWFNWTPTYSNWTVGTGGSAGTTAKFSMSGKTINFRIKSTLGSSGQSVGTNPTFTFPTATVSTYDTDAVVAWGRLKASNNVLGTGTWATTTTCTLTRFDANVDNNTVTSTTPTTWNAGSSFYLQGVVEAA